MERVFWLFPIVFMIHEMEEIIGFRLWFEKNFDLVKKYSMLEKLYSNFSSEGFAIAVLEEYIICIIVTGISIFWEIYIIWIGVFIAFVIHLVIHIIQSLVIRRYIPALISSITLLPISIFLISKSIHYFGYHFTDIAMISILSVILMVLNLILVHWIMRIVTQRIKKIIICKIYSLINTGAVNQKGLLFFLCHFSKEKASINQKRYLTKRSLSSTYL